MKPIIKCGCRKMDLILKYLNPHFFTIKVMLFLELAWMPVMMKKIIIQLVKFMIENNIHDSRRMTRIEWKKFLKENKLTNKEEIYTLLAHTEECVHIPELMDFLKNYNNIVLTGGSVTECLKEV